MYPAETREMKYQIIKKCMYSVHTSTYQLMTLKYLPGTYFFYRFGTRKPTFCIGLNLVHTSTYSRKKVCTEYILSEKSTYQVQTGLCPFISVSYYSMVHTGMYRYVPGMYNWSRFQMICPSHGRAVTGMPSGPASDDGGTDRLRLRLGRV